MCRPLGSKDTHQRERAYGRNLTTHEMNLLIREFGSLCTESIGVAMGVSRETIRIHAIAGERKLRRMRHVLEVEL